MSVLKTNSPAKKSCNIWSDLNMSCIIEKKKKKKKKESM